MATTTMIEKRAISVRRRNAPEGGIRNIKYSTETSRVKKPPIKG
jgi:hypothetical protein